MDAVFIIVVSVELCYRLLLPIPLISDPFATLSYAGVNQSQRQPLLPALAPALPQIPQRVPLMLSVPSHCRHPRQ